jgi:spore germination cell wall hydrolase CwlJ-like protein
MTLSVRHSGIAAALLGFIAFAAHASPVVAQITSANPGVTNAAQVAPADLAATMRGRSLDEQVVAYGRVETDNEEQDCLANAVYFEARGEPIEGQLAVAEVVLNRASSGRYPTDLCAVITQKAQFSFIRRGRFPSADRSSEAWKKAVAIASIARQKLAANLPSSVLWYHATYVSPKWGKRLTRQTQIGLHIFYS